MLFALRQPATLLGLVLGYAVGMVALSAAVRRFERAARGPAPWWHSQTWLDPYGAVGALLAGTGWAPRPEIRRGFGSSERRRLWTVAALSVLVPGLLAVVGIGSYIAWAGHELLPFFGTTSVLHGSQVITTSTGQRVALGFGTENLAMALLSIVPIPPLATGVAAWSTFPRSPGTRRFAAHLLEEQWGIAVLLVLLIVPLAGEQPALLSLVGSVADRIVHAL
ncbi:MAG TPA: hypothetical protein VHV76_06395 [Mycobacteriales bacterium]|nr:hypothetical protein [Mycobacteriales bacterium]